MKAIGGSEWGPQIMRSAAARQYLSEEEIEKFYSDLSKSTKKEVKKEFLGKDNDQRLGPFGEGWLTDDKEMI